jgi:hypothetical protein
MPVIGRRSLHHPADGSGSGSSGPAGRRPSPGKQTLVSALESPDPAPSTVPRAADDDPVWETWDPETQSWRGDDDRGPRSSAGRGIGSRGPAIAARVAGAVYIADGRFHLASAAGDIDIRIARVITPVLRMRRHPDGDGMLLEIPLDLGDDELDDAIVAQLSALHAPGAAGPTGEP